MRSESHYQREVNNESLLISHASGHKVSYHLSTPESLENSYVIPQDSGHSISPQTFQCSPYSSVSIETTSLERSFIWRRQKSVMKVIMFRNLIYDISYLVTMSELITLFTSQFLIYKRDLIKLASRVIGGFSGIIYAKR